MIRSQSLATSRRVVRVLATRNVEWNAPIFKADQELAAKVTQFRSWIGQAETMAKTYSELPTPIDFDAAKKTVRNVQLIEALEEMYKTAQPPVETYEWDPVDKAARLAHIEEAKEYLIFNQEMIEDTEREIELLKNNRTTRNTSAADIANLYPDIEEEVEGELTRREWFKDLAAK